MEVEWDYNSTVEAFRCLYESKAQVNLVWGGRDSGKSHNMGHILLEKNLFEPYFKCILTRKVQDTIRGSNYAVMMNAIDELGLSDLFDDTLSPLAISNKVNSNNFLGIGADNPGKIKSLLNPTDLYAEEANQLANDSLDVIITTLRGEADTQAWLLFNPEVNPKTGVCDVIERFFPDGEKGIDRFYSTPEAPKVVEWNRDFEFMFRGKMTKQSISFLSLHTTLDHNPYCTPDRAAYYETLIGVDDNKYNVWRNGRIGQKQNENPFFKSDETDNFVYLDGKYEFINGLPLKMSFDFNRNPCTVVICQINLGEVREKPPGLYIYETIQIKGGTELLCDELINRRLDMHHGLVEATGDNNGTHKKSNSLHSDVDILERKLKVRFHTNRGVNELQKESRITVNYWLVHGKTFIYKDSNAALIKDLKTGEIDEKGGIKKDRNSHPQDAGDAFRYIFPEWLGATVSDLEKVFPRLRKAQAFWDKYKDHFK